MMNEIHLPEDIKLVTEASTSTISLGMVQQDDALAKWVYVLIAPFPTTQDDIELIQLKNYWMEQVGALNTDLKLLLAPQTMEAFKRIWGEPSSQYVKVILDGEITDRDWVENEWAIIPFEELTPKWKVISIDNKSPLMSGFKVDDYPLTIPFGLRNQFEDASHTELLVEKGFEIPKSNFDPELMTTVLMTGTTALVRSTAERMETKGIDYPGQAIGAVLRDADFTHISNEVSFSPYCPEPNPMIATLRFCSNPDYVQLFNETGIDVIELTGNHVMDYNADSFLFTLDLYEEKGFRVYGGGRNSEEARKALIITHNNNRLAFIGCNAVGPDFAWATEVSPGAAKCDFEWLQGEISRLKAEGYLVIATLQDGENYDIMPMPWVKNHLDQLSDAGADIVSGSQAHFPQGYSFRKNGIIHYGLGNLFFDQMDFPVVGIRQELYDKQIFYDGRHISTVILTGMLEDYAQPRLMTTEERETFLEKIFNVSGW